MSNSDFFNHLNIKLLESLFNNYGQENFDELRFGQFKGQETQIYKTKLRNFLRKKFIPNYEVRELIESYNSLISKYGDKLQIVYSHLNKASQKLFIDIIAYRMLGYKKVKLPLNDSFYWKALERVKELKNSEDKIDPKFLHFILERFDLKDIGYNIELYFSELGVAIDYIIEQYAFKINNEYIVQADAGDVVLDVGGCWGDTSLYFSHKVGDSGKVYSFEFIPNNIEIFDRNINLNPNLKDRITLIKRPVSETSDKTIYYRDLGPGSSISAEIFEDQTGSAQTISIDDFVERENISKIDFIKMDIEGAEPFALRGALNTIKEFRPKLAVAIYHSMDDFVNIPKWLIDLNLNYEFYLGHYTIHSEETILFALPR